jgi:hypothetical protein
MPNRYQREIEEILSRMEDSEPHRGPGDRTRPFQRPPARARTLPSIHLPFANLLLLVSVALRLIATGLAFYNGAANLLTGILGAIALLLFIVGLIVGWRSYGRPRSTSQWRGSNSAYVEQQPTPIHRNPLSALITRIRVFRLRRQYRRAQRDHDES